MEVYGKLESILVHRNDPTFPLDPYFQVAVSILRAMNAWPKYKLTNILPESDSQRCRVYKVIAYFTQKVYG